MPPVLTKIFILLSLFSYPFFSTADSSQIRRILTSLNTQQENNRYLSSDSASSYKLDKWHLFSFQPFYPLKSNKGKYLSSVRYNFTFNSWFDRQIKQYIGHWNIRAGLFWIHDLNIFKNKKAIYPYPLLSSLEFNWELAYFPYVKPFIGWGVAWHNPFKKTDLKKKNYFKLDASSKNKLHIFSLGAFFSFDLLDPSFATRMQHEYSIFDMGFFAEYQRYMPFSNFKWANAIEKGFFFGLFLSL